jgi:cell division protease FtsH
MTIVGLILTFLSLVGAASLFCFNDRFRREFFRAAWALRMLVLLPAIVFGLCYTLLGASTTMGMLPQALMLAFQLIFMMFAMVIQWVAMMWIMARPRIDWYMPGEVVDDLTWDDYVGNDEIRREFQDLLDFIQNPDKYRAMGATLPKGVLMLGEPGVGKTYLARIVANQAGVPIAICESTSMQSPFVAVGALMVKSLYKKLRKYAEQYGASLVFFDEIDAIGMSRSGGGGQMGLGMMGGFMGGGMGGGILNALLGCMDGINSTEGFMKRAGRRFGLVSPKSKPKPVTVITIGATNAPIEALDRALTREGRFDKKLRVTVAGDKGLREQIAYFLRKRPHDETVVVDDLVSDFRGQTPVAINSVFNNAVIKAVRARREKISYTDVRDALWDRAFGVPEPIELNEDDERRVAYHEGGHAIMSVLYPVHGWRCFGATIRPRGDALGMVMSAPTRELHTMTKEDLCRRILLAVGSRAVEVEKLGIEMNGFSGDLSQATMTAVAMLSQYGMGEHMISFGALGMPTHQAVVVDAERLIRAHFELARQIVRDNPQAVDAIAQALIDQKDISGRDVVKIVEAVAQPQFESISEQVFAIYERLKEEDKAKGGKNLLEAAGPAAPAKEGANGKSSFEDAIGKCLSCRHGMVLH